MVPLRLCRPAGESSSTDEVVLPGLQETAEEMMALVHRQLSGGWGGCGGAVRRVRASSDG